MSSVWGFVQSVTRNLDEAAGLGAAAPDAINGRDTYDRRTPAHHDLEAEVEEVDPDFEKDLQDSATPPPEGLGADSRHDVVNADRRGAAPLTDPLSPTTRFTPEGAPLSNAVVVEAAAGDVVNAADPAVAQPLPSAPVTVVVAAVPVVATPAPASSEAPRRTGEVEALTRALRKAEAEIAVLRDRAAAAASGASREEQLLDEGRQLAAEVGRERERAKVLATERRALEAKLMGALQQVDAATLREAQTNEQKQLLSAERDRLKERVAELLGEHSRRANDVEATARDLEEARLKLAQQRDEHQRALAATNKEAEARIDDAAQQLRAAHEEIDRLKTEVQQAVVDCEQRIATAQREVVALTHRALNAEARCLDLTQHASEVTADVRSDAERLQAQLAAAHATRRTFEAKSISLERDLAESREALRAVETSTLDRVTQCHDEITQLRRELAAAHKNTEREKQRSQALTLRNEELTEEANRHLASLQAEAVRTSSRAAATVAAAGSIANDGTADAGGGVAHHLRAGGAATTLATEDEALLLIERLLGGPQHHHHHGVNGLGIPAPAPAAAGKVERALARAAFELRDARRSMVELRESYTDLQAKHDVLLEMYGQQAEELAELATAAAGHHGDDRRPDP